MGKNIFLLLLILLGAFIVRLYRVDSPIADWHSWRQADTASVTKIYVQEGIDPLHPRYFDISNVQTGFDNPAGYRFVEFPLYNILHALLFSAFGIFSLDTWGRVLSAIFSTTTVLFVYLIGRKFVDVRTGIFAAILYAFMPFSVYYGRVILPDVAMTTMIYGALYFFSKWSEIAFRKSSFWFGLAALFTALSFLFKPFALFFTLPMLYMALSVDKGMLFKRWQLWVFAFVSIVPLVLWRWWIAQYPEGVPVSAWLFNEGNIRFTGAYFYWIFAERIGKLILGYFGAFLLFLGFLRLPKEKNYLFFVSLLLSTLIYLVVIARGNVQHDYYQIIILPSVALILGRGLSALFHLVTRENQRAAQVITGVTILFMFSFSWYYVRDFFNINNPSVVVAGQKADEVLPQNARVIAPYGGDTTLLYYINRPGWPVFQDSIEKLIEKGATHLVIVKPNQQDLDGFGQQYEIIAQADDYLILKLQ